MSALLCPICRQPVERGNRAFPFCGPRCRQVDLSRWLNQEYSLSDEPDEEDSDFWPDHLDGDDD